MEVLEEVIQRTWPLVNPGAGPRQSEVSLPFPSLRNKCSTKTILLYDSSYRYSYSRRNKMEHRKEFAILMIFRIWPSRIPFPVGSDSKCRRPGFYPWIGKISWRRAWQPTPVFLPKESQGQRSLEGCSPQGCKESDRTERLSTAPTYPEWQLSSRTQTWENNGLLTPSGQYMWLNQ